MNGSEISGKSKEARFVEVYNDADTYPALEDVAQALGRSVKTVLNYVPILRMRQAAGQKIPLLKIVRSSNGKIETLDLPEEVPEADDAPEITPRQHAHRRAEALRASVSALLTSSRYPVSNAHAVVIESHLTTRYDRGSGSRVERESTPRTWLSDTLRVAPVSDPRGRRFIFSGAQNDTPVDPVFWKNLTAYARFLGAEVIVGPWTYETTWWSENTPSSRDYDPALKEHLCFGQMEIGDKLVFCGEMNTLPTAARPISDLTTYSRGRWAVFPHAKLQLVSVPSTNPMEQAFQIMTTGAVTRPKVVPRKAGVKSIFNHVLGATLVEIDHDGDIFCRQLVADETGGFQDLDIRVGNGRIHPGCRVDALNAGDLHVAKLDRVNALATFGAFEGARAGGSMLEVLNPRHLMLHDLHDHESRNHHAKDDASHRVEMAERGRDSVCEELERSVRFLREVRRSDTAITVVESNHDLALERYVREGRYREDGVNYRFGLLLDTAYHDWRVEVAQALDMNQPVPDFSLLEWALRHLGGRDLDAVNWVTDGRSMKIGDVEVGNHGFRGPNGSRGSVLSFARLGSKITIGHGHSPAILDGVFMAGVMSLNHGYNKGLSGWAVSHVVQYPNGTRALVTMQNGKWRARL